MADGEDMEIGRPSLARSMSTRSKFAKQFKSGHQSLEWDTGMLAFHAGGAFFCVLLAVLLIALEESPARFLWAFLLLIGLCFFLYLLLNPPERVELYTNRIVVRLKIHGKFLIPLKNVAGVEPVDNALTFCKPCLYHTRATQLGESVYIESSSGCSPMGMIVTVENRAEFVSALRELMSGGTTSDGAAAEGQADDDNDDDEAMD